MADEKKTLRSRLAEVWGKVWAKTPGILVGVALAAGAGLVLPYISSGPENKSYDIPFQWRPWIFPSKVVMVYLDDISYQELHQKYTEPWNRAYFTKLLNRCNEDGAAAVVFDIVFSDPMNPRTDQEFADAMGAYNKAIISADWTIGYNKENKPEQVYALPLPLFNGSAIDLGASTLVPDEGEFIRQYRPTLPGKPGDATNSEAWVTAVLLDQSFKQRTNLMTQRFWINYYAPEIALPSVSFYKAIADHASGLPPGYFSNKVVFVGAKIQTHLAAERKDEYSTPFSYIDDNIYRWMGGVTIHATAFLNLFRGDYLRRMDWRYEHLIFLVLGVIYGGGLVLCRPVSAVVIGLLSMALAAEVDYFIFDRYFYWFNWVIVAGAQIPLAIVWAVTYNSVRLHVERKLFEQSLSLYLTPKLVKKFADNPQLRRPGAKKQMLTILFTDIAGFTTISEGMDPDELARLMNGYFQAAVNSCIFPTEGTVVKYIGDAIFAFWNAPDEQKDHAYRGCEAALRFCALPPQTVNGQQLVTRLGLHTGEANVGNFGSDQRFDYTALGENINLASRMEGLNKYMGTRVLLTSDTYREVASRVVARHLGLFRLKGFEKAVAVYELIAFAEKADESRPLREQFSMALDKFAKRNFDGAEEAFRRVLQLCPEDGPAKFYLEHFEEIRASELPPEWKGEITLKDK